MYGCTYVRMYECVLFVIISFGIGIGVGVLVLSVYVVVLGW